MNSPIPPAFSAQRLGAFARLGAVLACLWLLMAPAAVRAEDYPLRIEHAFGTTILPAKPVRVATVNWANHEVALALGVVPVGFARASFGDDDGDGLLPWVKERLDALGAPTPVLFDEGDGIDFEAVAATRPDVILAAYSGLSPQDYEMLSRIAPVVAYPSAPWSTGWREMIALNSAGMGMAAEGQALIADLDGQIARVRAAHPEFAGKTAMFVTHLSPVDLSRIRFYTDNDSRVQFLHDLGFTSPALVAEASTAGLFSGEISAERIDALADVDVLVTYGGRPLLDKINTDLLLARLPAIRRGALVLLGNDPLGTAANPTPLSLPYVLEAYAEQLSAAVGAAK